MKKLLIGLAALFVLLSFSGCKQDVCTATIDEIFWTKTDPSIYDDPDYGYYLKQEYLPRDNSVNNDEYAWLVAFISDPDGIVEKVQMTCGADKFEYGITNSTGTYVVYWKDALRTSATSTSTYVTNYRLVCRDGTMSKGKSINLTIVK